MPFTPASDNTLQVRIESEGVSGFRGSMDNAISSLFSFRTAVGAAGAGLAALATGSLVAATKSAADFEQAMVEVEKVTDAATAAALSSEIKDLATTIPLAQNELAELTADAARFGIRGTDNIRSFTESVARLATATDLSVSEAGESMAKLAELTDTPITDIENLGSAINTLSNNFATSTSEIVDNMLRSSASLSQLGLNQREIAGLGAALNEVSPNAARAGTRLRRVAQELLDPRKVTQVAEALGMTVEEFKEIRDEDPTGVILRIAESMAEGGAEADRLRATFTTVSQQALAGLGQNLEGTRQALETSNSSFAEATSLQREFDAATDTFNSKLKLMQNRIRNNAIEIGNVLLPVATDLLDTVNEFLINGDSLLNQLSAQEKAWGLVAVAIGGTLAAIAAFVGGPIALAIGAVTALAAAYHENFLGIRDDVDQTFAGLIELWETHSGPLMEEVRAWQEIFRQFWAEWGDEITAVAEVAWDVIRVTILTAADGILTGLKVLSAFLRGDWETAWESAIGFVNRTFERLEFGGIKEAINDALSLPFETTVGRINVGGETVFGGETIRIPALAEGGLITRGTLAMVGESGPEAVVPLDRLKDVIGGTAGELMVVVQFEGESTLVEEARRNAKVVVKREMKSQSRRVERLETRSSVD